MNHRLNRLLHPVSHRCFDVAIDHGFFNEAVFLPGIEDIARAVDTGSVPVLMGVVHDALTVDAALSLLPG